MFRRFMLAAALVPLACDAGRDDARNTADASFLAPQVTPEQLADRVARFAPRDIGFDDSSLEPWERAVLRRLVAASDIMHTVFAHQVSRDNDRWAATVAEHPDLEAADTYYRIMVGPWDRLADDEPFLDAGPKPLGAGYYPPDITKQEFENWVAGHPDQKDAFTGYFTIIERDGNGGLRAVPYSEAYRADLERAASLLDEAADLSRNASLSDYLRKRADAFLSDDYFDSDLAWMDIDSRIEPTIGPYEVYEDKLFGYKAAFESFVTIEDSAASNELRRLKAELPGLERDLPIDDRYKNPNRAFESPIRVVDVAYTAGDTRAGVQTTAFNLPNDVRVHERKGSKKVMLRNVARAKFDAILMPIAQTLLAPDMLPAVDFHPWFTNVVMHELAHGLGPSTVTTPTGERMPVNQALRDRYSALEEAKADVTGLHNLTVLARNGVYDDAFVKAAFTGHIADLFRAVRFGTGEAHGKANLIQFNWLIEKNALVADAASGRFSADLQKVQDANRELAREILTIQAEGDYDAAGAFLERYGTTPPVLAAALERLEDVPVDIRPHYTIVDRMAAW